MLLLTFLLIPGIFAASTKKIGDYAVTIDNHVLTNIVPYKLINGHLNKSLNLSGLHISKIVKRAFDNMPEIESLDLSKNNIDTLRRGVFTPLRNLKHLSLADNGLENFQKAFMGLDKLESLDISMNNVKRLGKSDFFGISTLTHIDTSGDQIQTISRVLFDQTYANESAQAILCQHDGIVSSLRRRAKSKPVPTGCTRVQIDPGYPHWVRLNRSGITGFDRNWYNLYNTEIDGLDLRGNDIVDIPTELVSGLPRSLKYIDLSNNKIERVNERSFVHKNLEWLYLSNNLINKIESDAFKDTSLERLRLDGNRLNDLRFVATLPSCLLRLDLAKNQLGELQLARSFSTLRKLTHLQLTENQITELKREDFFGLNSLTNLYLQGNGLKKIYPDCFDRVPNLKRLFLGNNNLTNLEYDVFHLVKEMKILDLSHNKLTTLPRFVFLQLKTLRQLYLNDNSLTSLHRAFVGLFELNWLDISRNHIGPAEKDDFTGVPITVNILSNDNTISSAILKARLSKPRLPDGSEEGQSALLCMNNGVITTVRQITKEDPPISEECQMIELVVPSLPTPSEIILNLKGRGITGFAKNWYRLRTNVTTIILDSNDISEVTSEMLNDLPEDVKRVDVRANWIERLNKGVVVNEHLRILNLDNNKISEIEEDALVNTKLVELGVSNNFLNGTGFVAGMPTNLMRLNATRNNVEDIPAGTFSRLNNLRSLYLDNVYLNHIGPESFRGLTQLNILSLNENELSAIDENVFQDTKGLEKLYLRRNVLQSLDQGLFRDLTRLSHVDLLGNRFHDVTKKSLPYFTDSLQSVDLRNNGMRTVEAGSFVGGLRYELLLQNNRLETIDKGVFMLPNLVVLNLANNLLKGLNGDSFTGMPNLEELYVDGNAIARIDPGAVKYLNKLYMLDLSDNPIGELQNGAFSGLANLSNQKFEALIQVTVSGVKHIHGGLFGDESESSY